MSPKRQPISRLWLCWVPSWAAHYLICRQWMKCAVLWSGAPRGSLCTLKCICLCVRSCQCVIMHARHLLGAPQCAAPIDHFTRVQSWLRINIALFWHFLMCTVSSGGAWLQLRVMTAQQAAILCFHRQIRKIWWKQRLYSRAEECMSY